MVMPSNHLIFCCPLLLLPSIFPSIRVFSNESALRIRWPRYWSFSFNTSPSNERPRLISLRMDWLDLIAVQGTLKSLFQHHSSKALIVLCSAFFIVQLSHPYMTTGKTIALTRWTFFGKVISLLFMLSRLVITFLPKNTQDWSPLGWSGWISFRMEWLDLLAVHGMDFQESSPTPQFKSISSSALSFLHSPTLTSIHYHCKNHSLD